jgi:hypothetical protein
VIESVKSVHAASAQGDARQTFSESMRLALNAVGMKLGSRAAMHVFGGFIEEAADKNNRRAKRAKGGPSK